MPGTLWHACSRLSKWMNVLSGGKPGQTLCARIARKHGSWCLFCRVVGWAVMDPLHCLKEILHEDK